MSDKPEPLAAILAEARNKYTVHDCNECDYRKSCDLRFDCDECKTKRKSISLAFGIEDDYFTKLLDQIEAAVERERNAHTNDIHDALYKATGIPGNVVAMRAALEECGRALEKTQCSSAFQAANTGSSYITAALSSAHAALSAPARNCDVGTAEEQAKRFKSFCDKHNRCGSCPLDFTDDIVACPIEWGQMPFDPAEGGAK